MPPKRHRDDKAPASSKKFKVGDLVNVAPRPGPGKNSESGVARVTGVGTDGYNVKFVVGSAGGVAVAPTWLSAVVVDTNSGELPARTPRTPRKPSAASAVAATPSTKSAKTPTPAAAKTPRASAAKKPPASAASKAAATARKSTSTPKSTARKASPAPLKAAPKATPKATPKAKPRASTRGKQESPEAEEEDDEEEEDGDLSESVSKTPPRGVITVYGDEANSEAEGEEGGISPPSPEFKHVGGGIRVGEDAFSDGTVGLNSLVAQYAKAKLKLASDASGTGGGAKVKGATNVAAGSGISQALAGESRSRGVSTVFNVMREFFARLHWGLGFKLLVLAAISGLIAISAMALQTRFRGLMPPEHLSGHPLLFEPNLVPEKTAAELRRLLREVGAFRGFPTNQRDTSFYEAKREHVGEAVPLEPPDTDHGTPWCKHPFLAPNKRGDACVLPGRVDIGRHFVTTGGVDGLKEPYERMISRLLTFGFYVFDLSTVPAAQDLFADGHFRQLARDVCPKHKPHLDPFQFNFILQLPGQTVAAHLDGVYFWGASRFDLPQWLLAAMQLAAGRIQLFKERFVDQVQVVAYLHEWAPDFAPGGFNNSNKKKKNNNNTSKKRAGEFVYFTGVDGPGGTLESPHPRGGSAVDGTKTVHASQVYRPQDAPPPLTKDDLDARLVYFPAGSGAASASTASENAAAAAAAAAASTSAADSDVGTAATVWTTGTAYSVGPAGGAAATGAESASSPPPPATSPTSSTTATKAGTWQVLRNGNEPLGPVYDDDDLRISIVYRARCFESESEANRYRAQLHRPGGARGEGPLSLDNVLEAFAWDLHKQGLLPSATSDTSSPNTAASASADARSGRHAGSSSASAAAVASALEPTPDKRLALAMAILDTYVKYPYPTKAWLPFNYCALPRLVPWTATLLTPLCGRG